MIVWTIFFAVVYHATQIRAETCAQLDVKCRAACGDPDLWFWPSRFADRTPACTVDSNFLPPEQQTITQCFVPPGCDCRTETGMRCREYACDDCWRAEDLRGSKWVECCAYGCPNCDGTLTTDCQDYCLNTPFVFCINTLVTPAREGGLCNNVGCSGSRAFCIDYNMRVANRMSPAPTPLPTPRPTLPPTPRPTPVPTPPPTPMTPCTEAQCHLGFGLRGSSKWCKCCSLDCFGSQEACISNDDFCQPGGLCLSEPGICPDPVCVTQFQCDRGFGIPGTEKWCHCCANNCFDSKAACQTSNDFCEITNGQCTGTCCKSNLFTQDWCGVAPFSCDNSPCQIENSAGDACVPSCNSQSGCENSKCSESVRCIDRVAGWEGSACMRYTRSLTPRCQNGVAACVSPDDAAYCEGPSQRKVVVARCSEECMKACPIGGLIDEYDSIGEVCYTSGRRGCAEGFTCNLGGICDRLTAPPTPNPTPVPTPIPTPQPPTMAPTPVPTTLSPTPVPTTTSTSASTTTTTTTSTTSTTSTSSRTPPVAAGTTTTTTSTAMTPTTESESATTTTERLPATTLAVSDTTAAVRRNIAWNECEAMRGTCQLSAGGRSGSVLLYSESSEPPRAIVTLFGDSVDQTSPISLTVLDDIDTGNPTPIHSNHVQVDGTVGRSTICLQADPDLRLDSNKCFARYERDADEWTCVGDYRLDVNEMAPGVALACSTVDGPGSYAIVTEQAGGLDAGAIVGIIAAVLVVLALIGALVWFVFLRKDESESNLLFPNESGGAYSAAVVGGGRGDDSSGSSSSISESRNKNRKGTLLRDESLARAKVSGALSTPAIAQGILPSESSSSSEVAEADKVKAARKLRQMAEAEAARREKESKSWGDALGGGGGSKKKSKRKKKKRSVDSDDDDNDSDAGSSEQIAKLLQGLTSESVDTAKQRIRESALIDDLLDKYAGSDDDSSELLEKLLEEAEAKKAKRSKRSKRGKKESKKERRAKEAAEWGGDVEMAALPNKGAILRKKFATDAPQSTRD